VKALILKNGTIKSSWYSQRNGPGQVRLQKTGQAWEFKLIKRVGLINQSINRFISGNIAFIQNEIKHRTDDRQKKQTRQKAGLHLCFLPELCCRKTFSNKFFDVQ